MVRQKKGVTLVELLLLVLFIGVLATIAVPRFNFSVISKQNSDSLSSKIVADLRRTRRLAISDAANNTAGFALKMVGAGPYTGYEIENLGTVTTIDSHVVNSDVSCTGGSLFKFGPLGNLLAGSGSQLVISASGKTFTIDIISATGMIKCVEN